jgi:hypothetical protein
MAPLTESAIVYARMCELAATLHNPESMSELRRLGAVHRWEYERLPKWIQEAAGLSSANADVWGIPPQSEGKTNG